MDEASQYLEYMRKKDREHLRLLAIFHFVGAGLALLALLFLAVHYAFFQTLMTNPEMWKGASPGPPPAVFFGFFKWFYIVGAALIIVGGVLNVLSGLFIRARKHRIFSMIVAGINCAHIPLGTALGVFTFIVLSRESVSQEYSSN